LTISQSFRLKAVALHHPHFNVDCVDLSILIRTESKLKRKKCVYF
jgi:hypothetical protein